MHREEGSQLNAQDPGHWNWSSAAPAIFDRIPESEMPLHLKCPVLPVLRVASNSWPLLANALNPLPGGADERPDCDIAQSLVWCSLRLSLSWPTIQRIANRCASTDPKFWSRGKLIAEEG
jgi:hypothetical protein